MFTGLVEGQGTVRGLLAAGSGRRLTIDAPPEMLAPAPPPASDGLQPGDSVAVNGCCLTIVSRDGARLAFDVGYESLNRTNLGSLQPGEGVNLERSLPAGGRLGGHIVQGHVDGRGAVRDVVQDGEWTTMWFDVPGPLARYLIEKGSVAVDGVSLTVVAALPDRFSVMLIPHTLAATTLGRRRPGDAVNLEVDLVAKYVEKLLGGFLSR